MDESADIVDQAIAGNRNATRDLFHTVYDDLRRLAAAQMTGEPPGITLTPTALVHESFLKISADVQWNDPAHLYRTAARAMRQILVDAARRRRSLKRGGDFDRREVDPEQLATGKKPFDLLELDEALETLQQANADAAIVVVLRYFAGMTWVEIAQTLELSVDKVESLWGYGRAKLSCLLVESS